MQVHCRPDWSALSPDGARITIELVPELLGNTEFAEITRINVQMLADTLAGYMAALVPGGLFGLSQVGGGLCWDISCHPGSAVLLNFLLQGMANLGHDGADSLFFAAIRVVHGPDPLASVPVLPNRPAITFVHARGTLLQPRDLPQFRGGVMGLVISAPDDGAARLVRLLDRLSDCVDSQCFVPLVDQIPNSGWISSGLVERSDTGQLVLRLHGCNGHPVEAQVFVASVASVVGAWPERLAVIFDKADQSDG